MLCKILIINMLDYKFKRFIFNTVLKRLFCIQENGDVSLLIISYLLYKYALASL